MKSYATTILMLKKAVFLASITAIAFTPFLENSSVNAFTPIYSALLRQTTSSTTSAAPLQMSFKLPDMFSQTDNENNMTPSTPRALLSPISTEPEDLFVRAKAVLASDMAIRDPSLLSEDFIWIGPNVVSTGPLSKEEYLAAGKYFNLRATFPDLDYRAHDFRLDKRNARIVRLTARTVGTMRGELRLRNKEVIPPNGKRMTCPPEAISITFDKNGDKVTKICSGFTMDRLVGNTRGLCGVEAAATIAGAPPSEWDVYPPYTVISRFFARSVKQLKDPKSFLAPFPETVMTQLAKGVIAVVNGTSDPDILSPSFTFCGSIIGPLEKDSFLEAFTNFDLKTAFPDMKAEFTHFRVDPYDPYRVWVDGQSSGTRTGPILGNEGNNMRFEGPPEAISMTFDDDGFCTRLTLAVMDPTDGNTGGLGGVFGMFYATGIPLPPLVTRPLPQIIARVQKALLKPFTKRDVDDFTTVKKLTAAAAAAAAVQPIPSLTSKAPSTPDPKRSSPSEKFMPIPPSAPKKPDNDFASQKVKEQPGFKVNIPTMKPPSLRKKKKNDDKLQKAMLSPVDEDPSDPVSEAFASFFGTKAEENTKADKPKKPNRVNLGSTKDKVMKAKKDEETRRQRNLAVKKAKIEAENKRKSETDARAAKKAKEEAVAAQKAAAAKKQSAETAAAAKKAKEDSEAFARKKSVIRSEKNIQLGKSISPTIPAAFPFFAENKNEQNVQQRPPRGVPVLKNWKRNGDKSVSGFITGSDVFDEGEKVTTSPIKSGDFQPGAVVKTESGSQYFLS